MSQPDLTQALLAAQSPDQNIRSQAEQYLAQWQEASYPQFLAAAVSELANSAKPAEARRLAGLLLKNSLDAKEEARRQQLRARCECFGLKGPGWWQHLRTAAAVAVAVCTKKESTLLARESCCYGGGCDAQRSSACFCWTVVLLVLLEPLSSTLNVSTVCALRQVECPGRQRQAACAGRAAGHSAGKNSCGSGVSRLP